MRTLMLCLALVTTAAHAQYTNSMTGQQFNNMWSANADYVTSRMIQNNMLQSMMAAKTQPQRAAPPAKLAPPKWKFELTATDFVPTGARTIPEQLAASLPKEDRPQVVELGRGILGTLEAQPTLRKNNLATSIAVLLGISVQVVAGGELTDAEGEYLVRLINDGLASDPAFKKVSAQKRTVTSDTFLITGGLIAGISANAKSSGDAAQASLARDMAVQALGQFGVKVKK